MTPIHPSTPRPEGKRWDNLPGHTQDYIRALERALDRANTEVDRLRNEQQLDPETARARQQDFGADVLRDLPLPAYPINFHLGEDVSDREARLSVGLEQTARGWHLEVRSVSTGLVVSPRAANSVHIWPGKR